MSTEEHWARKDRLRREIKDFFDWVIKTERSKETETVDLAWAIASIIMEVVRAYKEET